MHIPPKGRVGVHSATSGEVTSGAPGIGRSCHPPHTLAGPSPAFNTPKAIGYKPGTGSKRGVRLGWGQGLEVQSKILGLKSHPGTRSASSGLGIPLQLRRVSVSAEPGV